ncbi:MAG: hypothetical protein M3317_01075 [Actinomycetota bacterium]|nr:hypothetical protein [Actinomycetota bacterium]
MQAYPATYGVVWDPSSGERVAIDADHRFLADRYLGRCYIRAELYSVGALDTVLDG